MRPALPLRLHALGWTPLFGVHAVLCLAFATRPELALRTSFVTVVPFALPGTLVLALPRRVPWWDERRSTFFVLQPTLACLVPPFVLQPLVENAIVHAVAPRRKSGRVDVSARRRGDRLQIEACDDGPGLPPTPPPTSSGLGLQLLRDRLGLLYGRDAWLSLQPLDGHGVRASLDLPAGLDPSGEPA